MATSRSKSRSATKTVTLIDRDGNQHEASNPAEINTLVYGQGYRPADSKTDLAEQVAALVAAEPTAAAPVAATQQSPSTSA